MESIVGTATRMTEVVRDALLASADNPGELERWVKKTGQNIRILNASLKKGQLNVGAKRNLESNIGKMKGFRVQMKALQRRGAGYNRPKERRSDRIRWEDVNSAFAGRVRTGVIINLKHVDPLTFLEDAFQLFLTRVKKALNDNPAMKVNVDFCCEFVKTTGEEVIHELKNFTTRNERILQTTDIKEWWQEHVQDNLVVQIEEFQERDSGWGLSAIVNLAININRYEPLRGSSYIPLPKEIAVKTAVINVKNDDDACFAWAIMAALHPHSIHPERVQQYPHYSTVLNLGGIRMPMTMGQIKKFEKQNLISINIYALEPKRRGFKVLPIQLTGDKKDRHVNLLLIQDTYDEDAEDIKFHYCWIKNLSRLVSRQVSRHGNKISVCDRCMHYFYSEEKLRKHGDECKDINDCKVRLPFTEADKIVKFTNIKNKIPVPFIVYADFESILKPISKRVGARTEIYQQHEAFSVGYYFKCSYDDSLSYYRCYRGEDCRKWFIRELLQIVENVEPVYWAPQPMELTPQQEKDFQASTECHICRKPFTADAPAVRDHNHLTSEFRGASHNSCNINFQDSLAIPVVFHNLSGYDSHYIIKDLAQEIEGYISLLPVNKEKYISFTKYIKNSDIKFRFIDSFRFMPYSLDKLVSFLDELKIVRKECPDLSEDQFKLLTRKGVFPYDYVRSWEKLEEPQLPAKELFENKMATASLDSLEAEERAKILEERQVNLNKDFAHANKVWTEFKCGTIGEYSDLYMKTDVLLLADVFENFRDTCFTSYGLDAAHYVSAPGLTWDAMLKYSQVELELITDIDMLMFIERGIRGGISQCSNRYAKANNKYIPDYDPARPTAYLQYFDINNLYGWALSECLPWGGFKWQRNPPNITQIPDDSPIGYILEVDLEYPEQVHDLHKDLPFCPQHLIPPGSNQKKLLTTLYDKERYVIHYRALKQAIRNGLRIKKIHRTLEFKQAAWMKSYIDLNTGMRAQAKNAFGKTFYKLMNNAAFGKTMEDVRKRKIVKIVCKWDGRFSAKVMVAKPNFHSRLILDEDLMIIELNKTEVLMNKPIYVGMSVLDISKTKVYDFHYDYMLPKFNSQCKVLYTDTDSLIYEVRCEDLYAEMKNDIARFDTSDYPQDNRYGIPCVNKKIPGLMKDENNGAVMTEFVGLRSKMYSVRVEGVDAVKKAKGVKGYVVKQSLTFQDYVECLHGGGELVREQNCIRSVQHNLYTMKQQKIALSSADNKRCLMPNTTDTLPWGHYSIMTH